MNVYDQAHQLAEAIKQSQEFKQYDELKKKVEANPELDNAIKDFMKKQFEFQAAQMMGQEMDQNLLGQISQLSAVLMSDPTAAMYLQNQMRFSVMMQDVFNIINEAAGFDMSGMMGNQ